MLSIPLRKFMFKKVPVTKPMVIWPYLWVIWKYIYVYEAFIIVDRT